MKFTKSMLITTCVVVGIGLVGIKLSLRTMETTSNPTITASQKPMPRLGWYARARIETLHKRAAHDLVKKLRSQASLDEFRDAGTVDGKTLDQLVTNGWALEFFKPAMAGLVYPFDGNVQILTRHTNWITSAVFSPDGLQIVTASADYTARVWTKQPDGTWTSVVLQGHTGLVYSAVFSPDGTTIVTASGDHTARVWTKIDLVGNNNVAAKIMLLQLLNRDSGTVFKNRPHLQKILPTFDGQAFNYLVKKYVLPPSVTGGIKARDSI